MRNQIRLSRDAAASRWVATDEVGEENPIWFAGGSARTTPKRGPLPGTPLSTKYGQQSNEGGAHGGRLSVDGACNQEPDGDTRRRDNDLDRFGPSDRRNTLRPVSLVYCIEMYL